MMRYSLVFILLSLPVFVYAQVSATATIPDLTNQTVMNQAAAGTVKNDANFWNFGDVKAGDVVEHQFVLKNNGTQILKILTWHTSCGCTLSDIPKKELAPGESTTVDVKFNSAKYNGEVKQFIYVDTDDKVNPVIRFDVVANVVK